VDEADAQGFMVSEYDDAGNMIEETVLTLKGPDTVEAALHDADGHGG
jgi:hypothetical protein